MNPAHQRLRDAIVEGRLTLPPDPELAQHAANAVAKPTPRGWRLVKCAQRAQIDALIALAMAAERAEQQQPTASVLGWI